MRNLVTLVGRGVHGHTDRKQTRPETPAGSVHRRSRTVVRGFFVSAVVAVLATAGCSSRTTPNTPTTSSPSTSAFAGVSSDSSGTSGSSIPASYPPGKELVCEARDRLKTSIAALTNTSVLKGGTTALKAAVDQVQTDLAALAAAGEQDYQPQIAALKSALQQLQTAVSGLGNGGASGSVTAVATAIAATGTAAGDLFTQLKTACGS